MANVLVERDSLSDIADSIRAKNGTQNTYKPGQMAAAIDALPSGGVTPTGELEISANGTYDVTNYASAEVDVPQGGITPTGSINITSNGTHDVTNYASAVVNVDAGGSVIPSEYEQIDYIEGTSGAVIDTGIKPTDDLMAIVKLCPLTVTGDGFLGTKGSGNDTNDWRLFNHSSTIYWDCGNGNGGRLSGGSMPVDGIKEIKLGNIYVHDYTTNKTILSKTSGISFSEIQYNIFINGVSASKTANCRWYYLQFYKGRDLVRDFVPCRRKSDDVYGMYDRVSGTFYTSVGSGSFTV